MNTILSALTILFIMCAAYWYWRSLKGIERTLFWPALLLKIVAGIGLGLIYQYYYYSLGGDTFTIFNEAIALADIFFANPRDYAELLFQRADPESPWLGSIRTAFFIKGVSIMTILAGRNYWITSLWFSFISFGAAFYLFRIVIHHFPKATMPAAVAFLFFPSIIFWSAGIIKESMGLAGLFIMAGFYLKLMKVEKPGITDVFISAISLFVVWNLKYYWLAVFLPVVMTSLIVHYGFQRYRIASRYKLVGWMVLFAIICLGVSSLHPNFYPSRLLDVVLENYRAFEEASSASDLISFSSLSPRWQSVVLNSPWALFSGLFRPFLWEADNILKMVISIENSVILILVLGSITQLKNLMNAQQRLLILSVVVYVTLLCLFLTLSTPNFGSLSRYKVGFTPFLVFLILYQNPLLEKIKLLRFDRTKQK